MICWVIIHCLSVSCTKINNERCELVMWSSLQLISKQWIILSLNKSLPELIYFLNIIGLNNWCTFFLLREKPINIKENNLVVAQSGVWILYEWSMNWEITFTASKTSSTRALTRRLERWKYLGWVVIVLFWFSSRFDHFSPCKVWINRFGCELLVCQGQQPTKTTWKEKLCWA